jgi:hypothetical protein
LFGVVGHKKKEESKTLKKKPRLRIKKWYKRIKINIVEIRIEK